MTPFSGMSDLMNYLVLISKATGESQLPALYDLSQMLGINVAKLREQLEVARTLGLVEVKPKTGIKRLPYQFRPAVQQSVTFAVGIDPRFFESYSDFRKHVESAYWFEAASRLTREDHACLLQMLEAAEQKLKQDMVQIPHREHRELHLGIYRKLDNPFVTGILEAYWEIYQSVGLDRYTDLTYLERVWAYHRKIVEAICTGDLDLGHRLLVEHMGLLDSRYKSSAIQMYE